MMASLYELRDRDLGDLAPVLYPFINAYRPHTKPRSSKEYRSQGAKPIVKESFVDELEGYYFELKGCYPEEAVSNEEAPE